MANVTVALTASEADVLVDLLAMVLDPEWQKEDTVTSRWTLNEWSAAGRASAYVEQALLDSQSGTLLAPHGCPG